MFPKFPNDDLSSMYSDAIRKANEQLGDLHLNYEDSIFKEHADDVSSQIGEKLQTQIDELRNQNKILENRFDELAERHKRDSKIQTRRFYVATAIAILSLLISIFALLR